ncbi:hypothetical protein IGI04_010921 [Brassica rapa subsp. trilocularis]|uniref:FBD domain-containing protein n=1 Tax=Brassica rapa subsp. trilocularis TaxID=1813537 RepID=A0ABQ7N1L3_BRACM|nr:hypothetical protein IGI04_010921 [Brassica rapa subsp. trilocularis]
MTRLSNSHSIVKSFSLSCKHEKSRVDSWIRTVLESGFLELHLKIVSTQCIESQLFTSNTLVQLTLYGGFCFDGTLTPPRSGVFFPNLKTLNLVSVWFWDDNMFEFLISGYPFLDVLLLHYGASDGLGLSSSIGVSNPSLKRLTVSYHFLAPDVEVFRTPSLGLVHKVTERCGDACVCIAKKRKKKMEEEELCCLSACQVKVLNISGYGGSRRELKQMRHFLGNLKCLVTVKVGVKAKKTTMLTITTRESPVLLLSFP